eukprot:PhF_6_TR31536/c0_g1_i2/m.46515
MFLRSKAIRIANSILHPEMTPNSVLAHMYQDNEYRNSKNDWVVFSQQLSPEDRITKGTHAQLRAWLESMVQHKDSEAVSQIVKYVRESGTSPLLPYHYHCLLRVCALHKDTAAVHQLLTHMETQQPHPILTANTVAWYMHYAWLCGHVQSALDIFSVAVELEGFGLMFAARDGWEEDDVAAATASFSPPLSMLLYIMTHTPELTPMPPEIGIIIASMMKMLGLKLGAQDYASMLHSVLEDPKSFPRVQRTVLMNAMRSTTLPDEEGITCFEYLVERVRASIKSPANAKGSTTKGTTKQTQYTETVLNALETLISRHGGVKQLHTIGFVQCRVTTLEGWVRRVMDMVVQEDAGPMSVYDRLISWAYGHKRYLFVLDLCTQMSVHIQSNESLFPMWACLPQIADSIASFPTNQIEAILPRYNHVLERALQNPQLSEQTILYLKTQSSLLCLSPKEMQEVLTTFQQQGKSATFSILREVYRCCLDTCVKWTPPNLKLSKGSVQERFRWWLFNDCRDIGLVMWGAVPDINVKIRHLYQRNGMPEPVKSEEDMRREARLFHDLVDPSINPTHPVENNHAPFKRTTKSILNLSHAHIPEHMTNSKTPNPYPHVVLNTLPSDLQHSDVFPWLWENVASIVSTHNSLWYIQDRETTLRLVRCFLHRLDWEKAIQIMTGAVQSVGYNMKTDRELQSIFKEIGDPSGSVCFKLAAKVLEGDVGQRGKTTSKTRRENPRFKDPSTTGAVPAEV